MLLENAISQKDNGSRPGIGQVVSLNHGAFDYEWLPGVWALNNLVNWNAENCLIVFLFLLLFFFLLKKQNKQKPASLNIKRINPT